MDRFIQDIRHAARMLRKAPAFTLVVIFTLAVGIGANTAMFSVVNAVLLSGLPFRDADRLLDLNEVEVDNRSRGAIAPANFVDWRAQTQSFDGMSVYQRRTFNVATGNAEPERLPGAVASTNFFDVLGASPILGRQFTVQDREPGQSAQVMLSYGIWQRRFAGDPQVVGQQLRLNGEPHTVVGVMPATVNFPQDAEFWLPATHDLPAAGPGDPRENRGLHYLRGIARLKAGVTVEQANAELETIGRQLAEAYPDTNSNFIPIVRPLQAQLVGSARTPLLILLGAVLCVLLIVVANVANLQMARATVRARELAIRAAIGATRNTLMRQLLTESVLLALVGGGIGVLLAFWGVDLILALDPGEVPRVAPITVNGQALAFASGLSVLTGLLFGLVPAWQASRPELQSTLKDQTRGSTGDGGRHYARGALVLAEVSISLVLLVGAGLLFRSLMTLLDVPLGFTSSQVLTMQVAPTGENYRSPEHFVGYWDQVVERVAAVPGVERAALTNAVPLGGNMGIFSFAVQGRPELPPSQQPLSHFVSVSPGYFATLGIPVLRGREFEPRDAVIAPRVILINEAMARREFSDADPIGARFSFGPGDDGEPEWLEIAGVVGNVRQYRADEEPVPMTYVVHTSAPQQALTLLVRTAGSPEAAAPSVRAAIQAVDGGLPISRARPLGEVVGASLAQRRFNMTLLMVFAGIALVLAVAGIYGTVAYAVAQRTSEIGIRLALGATPGEILRLIMWQAFKPVAAGLVVGVMASWLVSRALERLVYGISTTDPVTFMILPALLALVALAASGIPAIRAMRVDPMIALRVD
ncbi:MAG: ABC transporter permease [Vicinamibacterales bacterium]|nr:ABC transporter permease [Vicinamibacterales bacterium]